MCKQFRSSWANWQPLDHQRRSNKDIDDGHGFGVTGKYCRTKNVPIPSKLAKNLSQYLSCFSIIIPLRSLAGRLWSSELVKIKHPLTQSDLGHVTQLTLVLMYWPCRACQCARSSFINRNRQNTKLALVCFGLNERTNDLVITNNASVHKPDPVFTKIFKFRIKIRLKFQNN